MSTNFYLVNRTNQASEHIGKRSMGWAFTFQGQNFKTREAWERRLRAMGEQETIKDEYGAELTFDEFRDAVEATLRPHNGHKPIVKDGDYVMGGMTFKQDRTRNWVDGGCSFSNYEFS